MRGAASESRVTSSRLRPCLASSAAASVRTTLEQMALGDEAADALGRVADALDAMAAEAAGERGGGGGGGLAPGEAAAPTANGTAAVRKDKAAAATMATTRPAAAGGGRRGRGG